MSAVLPLPIVANAPHRLIKSDSTALRNPNILRVTYALAQQGNTTWILRCRVTGMLIVVILTTGTSIQSLKVDTMLQRTVLYQNTRWNLRVIVNKTVCEAEGADDGRSWDG